MNLLSLFMNSELSCMYYIIPVINKLIPLNTFIIVIIQQVGHVLTKLCNTLPPASGSHVSGHTGLRIPESSGYTVGWLSIWVSRTISKLPGVRKYRLWYWLLKIQTCKGGGCNLSTFSLYTAYCYTYLLILYLGVSHEYPKDIS